MNDKPGIFVSLAQLITLTRAAESDVSAQGAITAGINKAAISISLPGGRFSQRCSAAVQHISV
jgi:hypothetical protein